MKSNIVGRVGWRRKLETSANALGILMSARGDNFLVSGAAREPIIWPGHSGHISMEWPEVGPLRSILTCDEEPAADGAEAELGAEQVAHLAPVGLVGVAQLHARHVQLALGQHQGEGPGGRPALVAHERGRLRRLNEVLLVVEPADHLEEVARARPQLAPEQGVVVHAHELVGHAGFVILIDSCARRKRKREVSLLLLGSFGARESGARASRDRQIH